MQRTVHLLALLMVTMGLAGCIGDTGEDIDPQATDDLPEAFDTSRGWSQPLEPAQYEILEGRSLTLSSFDDTTISLGLFLPDIPGCDWDAEELPDRCRLPVVMDSGPYWGTGEEEVSFRPPLIEWLVPRGYAVAHMSVRGTGESGGCMEFMSLNEQRDVDETVTWLATQPWSNGNVGMMGRSYDGTTPFMAAAHGNPHLKTIVPISGVASVPDLMFKNGTSETRGPIMHSVVYWATFGLGAEPIESLDSQLCQETVDGQIEGTTAALTGDTASQYWQVRDFQGRILEDYNGSVWIVHGMEDWNVNPSQVVPWIQELQEAGIETRAWLGQWGHAYPDRVDEHRNVRWDWAQQTLEWFDFYLKEAGASPPLDVEVEDSLYVWRAEASYPPEDIAWQELALSGDMMLTPPEEAEAGSFTVTGPPSGMVVSGAVAADTGPHAVFGSEPLADDVRIAGLPQLHVTVTPTTPEGGQLFAQLYDVFPDGRQVRIGWAAIDLAFHAGGNTDPAQLTPGEPVVAKMQFEPMDAHVAEGHRLVLRIDKAGVEDVLASINPEPTTLTLGEESLLRLSTIERPNLTPSYLPPGGVNVTDGAGEETAVAPPPLRP